MIASDHVEPKSKDHKPDISDSVPILAGMDRQSKRVHAHMVANKGLMHMQANW